MNRGSARTANMVGICKVYPQGFARILEGEGAERSFIPPRSLYLGERQLKYYRSHLVARASRPLEHGRDALPAYPFQIDRLEAYPTN